MDWPNEFHVVVFTDAESFEPEEPLKKAAALDKWEGEDEEEEVKVNQTRFKLATLCRGLSELLAWPVSVKLMPG